MLTRQGYTGNSSLQLEHFRDHSFGFLKDLFSALGLKEHNLCIAPNHKSFCKRYKKEAQTFSKTFSAGLSLKFFIH